MKLKVLVAALSLVLGTTAFAATPTHHHHHGHHHGHHHKHQSKWHKHHAGKKHHHQAHQRAAQHDPIISPPGSVTVIR